MIEQLFDTDNPNVKLGFRTKNNYLERIQVETTQNSYTVVDNVETTVFTKKVTIIDSVNGY